jgi:hypothetical protein
MRGLGIPSSEPDRVRETQEQVLIHSYAAKVFFRRWPRQARHAHVRSIPVDGDADDRIAVDKRRHTVAGFVRRDSLA